MILIFLVCFYFGQATPQVGMLMTDASAILPPGLLNLLTANCKPYYERAPKFVAIADLDQDAIEAWGSEAVLPFMRKRNLHYLVHVNYIGEQILLQVWKNDGQQSNIFIPYTASLQAHFEDIAVGGILSMIEQLGAGLSASKRY